MPTPTSNMYGYGPNRGYPFSAFGSSDWQYLQDIYGPDYGAPITAAAQDQVFAGDGAPANAPQWGGMDVGGLQSDLAAKRFGDLMRGQSAGTQAKTQRQEQGGQGVLGVNNAFANALYGNVQNQLIAQNLKNQQANQNIGIGTSLFNQLPSFSNMLSGAGSIGSGIGSFIGTPFNTSMGAGGLNLSQLPKWLDPNTITSSAGGGTGLIGFLENPSTWLEVGSIAAGA